MDVSGQYNIDVANQVLDRWLAGISRTLTQPQRDEILSKYASNRSPLYLKLCFGEAAKWRSNDDVIALEPNITSMFKKRIKLLEKRHGRTFVSHALMAISTTPLSVDEILDVLSSDEARHYSNRHN